MEMKLATALERHDAEKREAERSYNELLKANADRLKLLDSLIALLRQYPKKTVFVLKTWYSRSLWLTLLAAFGILLGYGIHNGFDLFYARYLCAVFGTVGFLVTFFVGISFNGYTDVAKKAVQQDNRKELTCWLQFDSRGRWYLGRHIIESRSGLEYLKLFTEDEILDGFIETCDELKIDLRNHLGR